jgi:hypothetical protein
MDWLAWHDGYDTHAGMAERLVIVRRWIVTLVAEMRQPEIRILSMCAGDGRDVIGALLDDPRREAFSGILVETNPELVGRARTAIETADLRLEVREADAGLTDSYTGGAPADLLLACGVFGNISDADVHETIEALPSLLARDAPVIWTRHRRAPELTPQIRAWFTDAGFDEVAFEGVANGPQSVGVARFRGAPRPFQPGLRLFTFTREA